VNQLTQVIAEDRSLILLPSRSAVHRGETAEGVRVEPGEEAVGADVPDVVDRPSWDLVDQASWDSFPASDPPPWTLGYTGPP
jgi:hypothetical protein